MARLDTRTDVQLLKLAGTLVQNFTNSMEKQSSIKRENGKPENKLGEDFTKKESIVILKGQENTIIWGVIFSWGWRYKIYPCCKLL